MSSSHHPQPQPQVGGPVAPAHSLIVQWLLRGLALVCLLLGFIGIFLPVLPTTPFILLSAWAAARSSPRLLTWLENHTAFGPMLKDWRRGGVVRRHAKWAATLVMSASAVLLLLTAPKPWVAWLAIACMACVLLWLWRRPERYVAERPACNPND